MKTKKNLINKLAITMISLSAFHATNTLAQTTCYRFDNPPVNTVYEVGQTLNTQNADINILRFIGGINVGNARISESNIIDGGQPSLLISAATVQVIPNQRIQSVTLRYAENVPPVNNPQGWNLGANGDLLQWSGTLSAQNGVHLGKPGFGGRVAITVTEDLAPSSGWVEGTLTLESDPLLPLLPNRGIGRFAMGRTSQFLVDDVCLSE